MSALLRFYSIKQESDRGRLSLWHSERRGRGVFWGCRGYLWDWTETYWRQISLTTQKAAACVSLTALMDHWVWLHSPAALDCPACPRVSTAGESSDGGGRTVKASWARWSDPAAPSDPRFWGAEFLDPSREYKQTTEGGVVTLRDFSGFPVCCFFLKTPLVLCDPWGLVHWDFFLTPLSFYNTESGDKERRPPFYRRLKYLEDDPSSKKSNVLRLHPVFPWSTT